MALQYKPTKHAKYFEGETLTEQEHKDSCDINKMLRDARRGLQVRGGPPPQYGYDDTTMSALDFRIQKQNLEADLSEAAQTTELTTEQINALPPDVRKKFGFKTKKAQPNPAKTNDDPTTKNNAVPEPPKQNEPDPKNPKP